MQHGVSFDGAKSAAKIDGLVLKVLQSYKVYRPDAEGGVPEVIATLAQARGIETRILVARNFGFGRSFAFDGVDVESASSLGNVFSTPLAPTYPYLLHRRARETDILVHHMPFPITDLALLYPLPPHVALVVFWHAEILGRQKLKKLVSGAIAHALRRADRIVVTDASAIDNSPMLSLLAEKCRVAPLGIDTAFWSARDAASDAAVEELRQRYPRMVLAIGRLVPYKGLDILLKALTDVDGQLVVIGEGPQRHELERLAADLGVAARTTWTGHLTREQIRNHLRAAGVLAFPSTTIAEAFGLVQVEAMAAGLPIVNTALNTAVPNVARHEREALTVPPCDPRALASAIRRLLDDSPFARRLGEAGRSRALTQYTQDRFQSDMKTIYKEALEARRSAFARPLVA